MVGKSGVCVQREAKRSDEFIPFPISSTSNAHSGLFFLEMVQAYSSGERR